MAVQTTENQDNFYQRLSDVFQSGCILTSLYLGHELGLFKVLIDCNEPKTSVEIAKLANCKERYVREWLNSMAVGKIVDINAEGTHYWLPQHRRHALGPASKLLPKVLLLNCLQDVTEEVIACFKPDGPRGIPYEKYTTFHKAQAAMSLSEYHTTLISKFIPSVPGNLKEKLEQGNLCCLDVGCGVGLPSLLMAKAYPKCTFYGIDFSKDAITIATKKAAEEHISNVHYFHMDATKLDPNWTDKFDHVTTFDSVHDQAYPDKSLREIYRVLKPGAGFSMIDIRSQTNPAENLTDPIAPFLYTASLFHCMPVSLYFEGGMGLGTCWGKQKACQMLQEAGFRETQVFDMDYNEVNAHFFALK